VSCLQSFSSVVGPNGSGKSNVIDAMLFVFGKKAKQVSNEKLSASAAFPSTERRLMSTHTTNSLLSVLQLRLSKVSELIHNSSNYRNLESARVSVHFTEIIDLVCTA
jgi:structural maintenance of chromosome 4